MSGYGEGIYGVGPFGTSPAPYLEGDDHEDAVAVTPLEGTTGTTSHEG